jgi:hypothetical protein
MRAKRNGATWAMFLAKNVIPLLAGDAALGPRLGIVTMVKALD